MSVPFHELSQALTSSRRHFLREVIDCTHCIACVNVIPYVCHWLLELQIFQLHMLGTTARILLQVWGSITTISSHRNSKQLIWLYCSNQTAPQDSNVTSSLLHLLIGSRLTICIVQLVVEKICIHSLSHLLCVPRIEIFSSTHITNSADTFIWDISDVKLTFDDVFDLVRQAIQNHSFRVSRPMYSHQIPITDQLPIDYLNPSPMSSYFQEALNLQDGPLHQWTSPGTLSWASLPDRSR